MTRELLVKNDQELPVMKFNAMLLCIMQVSSAADYLPLLQQQRIQLDFESRRKAIWEAAQAAAAADVGGVIPESAAGDLLDEVSNLVESPTVIRGGFDPAFLELPE